jgi:predicted TPR repeat methyltransferase/DNA-binding transcriptional MerR regulator
MSEDLRGLRVAITGRLASMTRREVEDLIRERGGRPQSAVNRKTDLLVLGAEGLPVTVDGGLSRKLRRARELERDGQGLEIVGEDAFLERLGLEPDRPLYTTTQLGRILDVPGHRIRAWVRRGLVAPVKTSNRLAYFDFRQVATVKAVAGLVEGGVSADRIRRTLIELGAWLPDVEGSVRRLETRGGELLVRLEDGSVADPRGQLRLPFEERDDRPPIRVREADWFEEGLRREDAGDVVGAVEAYREAIREEGEDPELCFNLGNALYTIGEHEESATRFRRAVDLDPEYVEAWNNLANVLSELGDARAAVEAYRCALAIEPAYADAHYNFGETLFALGLHEEARRHWRTYLGLDPRSAWADHVRARLSETGMRHDGPGLS